MTEHPTGDRPLEPAAADAWHWQCTDDAGVVLARQDPHFASRQAAEDWLGEAFADLADDGVAAVTLFDGDGAIYGPMPLGPAG